jgi:hypothetical protein
MAVKNDFAAAANGIERAIALSKKHVLAGGEKPKTRGV